MKEHAAGQLKPTQGFGQQLLALEESTALQKHRQQSKRKHSLDVNNSRAQYLLLASSRQQWPTSQWPITNSQRCVDVLADLEAGCR